MQKISLKQDKGVFEDVIVIYNNGARAERKYKTGQPIDCYHRLYLSPKVLKLLLQIWKIGKKERNTARFHVEEYDAICKKRDELYAQFHKEFDNPYNLDWEIEEDYVCYTFYDYEYDYILIRERDGWRISCTRSATYSTGEECEIDTVEADDKFSPQIPETPETILKLPERILW